MDDFEKLGVFYLGQSFDLKGGQRTPDLLLYDSKDLVTHAVCVGMTGSGKTGLCIALIEEAALDGIPAIVIDPKGDLSNLLLTFPELRPDDFAPWVNEEDARRKGMDVGQFAAEQADLWKKGLSEWGESGDRIRRLRDAAEFAIYTPGSEAGLPVSILRSFDAPDAPTRADAEALRERVTNATTSLLGLLKIDADPVTSREHILISTLLDRAWRAGQSLDLASLVRQIQTPGIDRVGVIDLESFFPSKERAALAIALNNLLAAPSFSSWMEGEPLDIGRLLHTPAGKPRVAIFSIAHLGDAERMFFVSLLLNQMIGWMRTQPGTSSLRALLYMDEIFGYFPPVANPPSKGPLLTLLKQARAYGVGIVLATQNPVDLDYKGLSNAGTWFIGRLQAERDKARLLEGLEGAAVATGSTFDRGETERTIAGLSSRKFLINNVHASAPEVFESRWTMSYLRGPLARTEIKRLMDARRTAAEAPGPQASADPASHRAAQAPPPPAQDAGHASERPVLPPDIQQYFVPARQTRGDLVYEPMLAGAVQVRFTDIKSKIDVSRDTFYLTPFLDAGALPVDWQNAQEADVAVGDLEKAPAGGARYRPLLQAATRAANYTTWTRDLSNWIYRTAALEIMKSKALGLVSQPGESERDFRLRLQQSVREERDRLKEELRRKYAPKIAALDERKRRAQQALDRESEQASSRKVQTAISFGATLLNAVMGKRMVSVGTMGRATTAARDVGRTMKEAQDVDRARETLEAVEEQRSQLEDQMRQDLDGVDGPGGAASEALDTVALKPKKADITVRLVALVWVPRSASTA